MYIVAHLSVPHYERTRGNAHCHYVDWNMDNLYDDDGNVIGYNTEGEAGAEEWFIRWREGRTGYPWIDALMRQLKHDGWIHQYISPPYSLM
jgi:cryptochrome